MFTPVPHWCTPPLQVTWPVLSGEQMTNLQLLGSLCPKHWAFGLAEQGKSQEAQSCDPDGRAMLSSEDGSLLFSASLAMDCGFQFHGAQGSWLFLGCLRSKRKQRLSFLVTLLCLTVLQRVGGHFSGTLHHQLLAKEGTGAAGGSVWALPVPHILPYS